MRRELAMSGPVHIESRGMILARGEVAGIDASTREMIDAWTAYHPIKDPEQLRTLHYAECRLHSAETVELCRRLVSEQPGKVLFLYAHRGHQLQCKTPVLQSLLAKLPNCMQVHGLRVEQDDLPFELVLFGLAALKECDRCIIVKDNAIRLGTREVMSKSQTKYLVLSRSTGSWLIDRISIHDDENDIPSGRTIQSLNTFLTNEMMEGDSISLACRMTKAGFGIINLVCSREKETNNA